METLQLKHLAPYLPYNLKWVVIGPTESMYNGDITIMRTLSLDEDCATFSFLPDYYFNSKNELIQKPLLIPLSYAKTGLTMGDKTYMHFYDWLTRREREVFDHHHSNWTYRMIQEFSQYHFDWMKLIDAGLALNKLEYIK